MKAKLSILTALLLMPMAALHAANFGHTNWRGQFS